MNSRKCEICNNDVHRASYVKQLGSKKPLRKRETEQNDYTSMFISRTY